MLVEMVSNKGFIIVTISDLATNKQHRKYTTNTLQLYLDIDKEISINIERLFWGELHLDKLSKLSTYKTLKKRTSLTHICN